MTRVRPRRLVAATLTAALTGTLLVAAPSIASADAVAIPQAPVLSIIAKTESLPFTIEGGGPVEVAVLTGAQTPAAAVWTTTDELALAPYAGQDIRVLARQPGVTAPADTFDARYSVRDTYASAAGLGTTANPAEAIASTSTRFIGWATGYRDYAPGSNVDDVWKTPASALGRPSGGIDDPYGDNTKVVVLGDDGTITMTFSSPITDGPGPDFAVFENGFRVAGQLLDFIELARVQVSSNGDDFVEFDTASTHDAPVAAYAGAPANAYGGVAGRDVNNYGTPFDLAALANQPAVRSGDVDLSNITEVRIVDIVGDGEELDSFGRPIHDPFPTYGSGGFDLRGVGVLNRNAATITTPILQGVDTTTVDLTTAVSAGRAGALDVELELADDAEGTNAVVAGTGSVAAGQQAKDFSFRLDQIASGSTFWHRVVAKNAAGEISTTTRWTSFTKKPSTVTLGGSSHCVRTSGLADCNLGGTFTPHTDGPFVRWVETSENEDHADVTAHPRHASPTGAVTAKGLTLGRQYWYRLVGEHADGVRRTSEWGTFSATVAPSLAIPVLEGRKGTSITFTSEVRPGSATGATLFWQYTSGPASFRRDVVDLPRQDLPTGEDVVTSIHTLTDLSTTSNYSIRAVIELGDGTRVNGSPLTVSAEASPVPIVSSVTPGPGDAGTVSVLTRTPPHTYGQQSVTLEHTSHEDRSKIVSTPAVLERSTVVIAPIDGLEPATTYWVRGVWASTDPLLAGHTARSDWFAFTTPDLTPALGEPRVPPAGVTTDAAVVEVPVTAGAFDRSVSVEYSTDADHRDAETTAAQSVVAGTPVTDLSFDLPGLRSRTEYFWRVVSTSAGAAEATAWRSFTTARRPASVGGPTVSALGTTTATISATVDPGDLDQQVVVEVSPHADHAGATSTQARTVEGGSTPTAVSFALSGLAPRSDFTYRVVARGPDGDRVATDWSTFTTATPGAPVVSLGGDVGAAVVGDSITLTWSSSHATSLTASGGWDGAKDVAGGSETIELGEAGTHTFDLTARGEGGTTTGSVTVRVDHAPRALTVRVPKAPTYAGRSVRVTGSGLAAGESYRIEVSGIRVASGTADASGRVDRSVTVPTVLAAGARSVRLEGSTARRSGTARVTVVAAARFAVTRLKSSARSGSHQRVTVTGLAPYEPVRVSYRGATVVTGVATSAGRFSARFAVGRSAGPRTVKVFGLSTARRGSTTFTVTQ